MKVDEITRIVVLVVIGAFMMFVLQPFLYINLPILYLNDVDNFEDWVSNSYMIGAQIVFWGCLIATLIWLGFTSTSRLHRGNAIDKTQPVWWIIGLIPLAGIAFAVVLKGKSNDAVFSLTIFYVIDVLVLYWLTTATSTPGSFKFIPPFAETMRDLIGDK